MSKEYYGVMAEFTDTDELIAGAQKAYDAGYRDMDAYTPFPVHDLYKVLGLDKKTSWVPYIVLIGAIVGGLAGFFLQYYTSVHVYPINIAGRPLNSWQSFMVITFEMAVLGAVFSGVIGMFVLNKLPMPYHPLFDAEPFQFASRDKFFLCVMQSDPKFDLQGTESFLQGLNPVSVTAVEQGEIPVTD